MKSSNAPQARWALIAALLAPAPFIASASVAGLKANAQVSINTAARTMHGSLSAARNSADNTQRIDINNGTGTSTIAMRNSAGVSRLCQTQNPEHRDLLRNVSADSFIQVAFDAANFCTLIMVEHSSIHPPKSH